MIMFSYFPPLLRPRTREREVYRANLQDAAPEAADGGAGVWDQPEHHQGHLALRGAHRAGGAPHRSVVGSRVTWVIINLKKNYFLYLLFWFSKEKIINVMVFQDTRSATGRVTRM